MKWTSADNCLSRSVRKAIRERIPVLRTVLLLGLLSVYEYPTNARMRLKCRGKLTVEISLMKHVECRVDMSVRVTDQCGDVLILLDQSKNIYCVTCHI